MTAGNEDKRATLKHWGVGCRLCRVLPCQHQVEQETKETEREGKSEGVYSRALKVKVIVTEDKPLRVYW